MNAKWMNCSTGFRELTERLSERPLVAYLLRPGGDMDPPLYHQLAAMITSAGHPACTQMGIVELVDLAVVNIACTRPFVGCE
jgi:hypothetical protein